MEACCSLPGLPINRVNKYWGSLRKFWANLLMAWFLLISSPCGREVALLGKEDSNAHGY
jgi:hypothetical protein